MTNSDRLFLWLLTVMICVTIQWSAHYIKGDPIGLDAILIGIVGLIIYILTFKK